MKKKKNGKKIKGDNDKIKKSLKKDLILDWYFISCNIIILSLEKKSSTFVNCDTPILE